LKKTLQALEDDCDSVPALPASVFFLNKEMEVHPKRIFTITHKHINQERCMVEVYIRELEKYVDFNPQQIIPVVHYFVN